MSSIKPRVGFSDEYFGAVTRLHPNIQAKVNKLVLKFQSNPTSPGLNFEKLNAVKDPNMRSLRVDQSYRVILSSPEEGNVYIFLWVDNHDEAYDWARRHQCRVNPNTGTLQLYSTETNITEAQETPHTEQERLFHALKDRQLLKLGVPEEQMDLVRSISSESDLDGAQELLPSDAYEALFFITAGDTYENIILERELEESRSFDTANFAEALNRVQSMAKFTAHEDGELSDVMNACMEKWRVFLHPSQRKLAEGVKNGAVRVLGGAGTGKTVVAMHRAKWLAANIAKDGQKVLFTTFTKNLAIDIKKNLETICSKEEFERIEVINLDFLVQRYLRKHSYDYELVYDSGRLKPLWEKALSEAPDDLDFPDSFYQEEWSRVIQPQGIQSLNEYKRALRVGRGTRLNRMQRVAIWRVFEEYRSQLDRARFREIDDVYRDASALITSQDTTLGYCSVVVDEAQDMGTQAFHVIRSIVKEGPNDIFIVGDAHQRIYGRNKVILSRCGINIRGRARKLKINYRTTDEIRKWAVGLLEGKDIDDLDGGTDSNALYKSLTHGGPPIVEHFETAEQQAGFIKELLDQADDSTNNCCVVARTKKEITSIQGLLNSIGVETSLIQPDQAEKENGKLKLATVHRVKGLEFDTLILASANKGLIPLEYALKGKADNISIEEADTEERSLVYVAVTRARKNAFILSYGETSEYFS